MWLPTLGATILPCLQQTGDLLLAPPDRSAVTDERAKDAGLTKEEATALARDKFGLDAEKWNIAVIGQTKAGKSSLINASLGLTDNSPGT